MMLMRRIQRAINIKVIEGAEFEGGENRKGHRDIKMLKMILFLFLLSSIFKMQN